MTTETAIDQAKLEAFVGKALGDTSGLMTTVLAAIGDRLGLFKELAAHGPATSGELAARAGVNERYVREWLGGMAGAGYLEYAPASGRFSLPPEHAPVLAQEAGPVFFGGVHQEILGVLPVIPRVIEAFRHGGGVAQSAYGDDLYAGIERFTAGWFENLLLPVWLPAVPTAQAKLERGCTVADVGCGRGRALIALAQAYPASRYTGFDVHGPTIAQARVNATAAGVADRVTFVQGDAAHGLPEQYDLITTFDVVHDAVDPRGLLRAIRAALASDGRFLCLEINCSERLEENAGPLGTLFSGFSVLYCMTSSLAGGGEGLGTTGLPEARLQALCSEAGFGTVERVALENPFNSLYVARP